MPDSREQVLQSHAARLAALAIERNLAEEALRASEAKFRGLFEGVIEGVYQSTRDGRLVSVNSAFVKMLGYDSAEEMYALPSSVMLYWSAPDRADFVRRVDTRRRSALDGSDAAPARWHAGGGAGEFPRRARRHRPHRRLRRHGLRHHRAQARRAGHLRGKGSRARHAAVHRRRGDHHRRQRPASTTSIRSPSGSRAGPRPRRAAAPSARCCSSSTNPRASPWPTRSIACCSPARPPCPRTTTCW